MRRSESRVGQVFAVLTSAVLPATVSTLTATAILTAAGLLAAAPVQAQAAPARAQATSPNDVVDPALYAGLRWRSIGPARGGRVTAVAGVPSQPHTFYMGAAGGGVWKTTDYGQTWTPMTDGQISVGSIGAIAVAPSNPDVVYAGTGSEAIRANVSTGRGVYRSTDAGRTWHFLGLRDAGQIGAIVVDPHNPDRVFVAVLGHAFGNNDTRGVYRSTDGGQTWTRSLFVSDSVGAVDLVMKPGDPNTLYAAMWRAQRKPWTIISGMKGEDGIYRTTDGGAHWVQLTADLPHGLVGKIALAVTPARPDRLYALIEAVGDARGVYVSDDGGTSFRHVNHDFALLHRPFYYTRITAGPKNPDVLWVNGETSGFFKSTDGGHTFRRVRIPHGDNHGLWINPNNPDIMIQCSDGGATVSLDGGKTWSTEYNQPTAEIYQVAVDNRFPYRVYGAQQDNTTVMVPSRPPMDYRPDSDLQLWQPVGGCETGPPIPKPGDPDIVYNNCKGRFSVYNRKTGQEQQYYPGAVSMYGTAPKDLPYRFQRTSPIEVSPFDPDRVYYGSQYLLMTIDNGLHWKKISPDLTAHPPGTQGISGGPITRDITGEEVYSTIYAIRESPVQRGVIWVGSNDGLVHVTKDAGKTWTDVTPKGLPPGGRVQNIEPGPHDAARAYIAVYRFLLDDFRPYIYETSDYGQSWTLLTNGRNGIPDDYPTRVVREDPKVPGLLYAGTEMGAFVSFDGGAHWQSLQLNLPRTPVTDIRVKDNDLVISTMGRGFWIMYDVEPLRALAAHHASVASSMPQLFPPEPAYRMRYPSVGTGPAAPDYPPPGAAIDYTLPAGFNGPVRIEVQDQNMKVIRIFSSEGESGPGAVSGAGRGGTQATDSAAAEARALRAGTPRLPTTPGMHRVYWDLRYAPPAGVPVGRFGPHGPMATPGPYWIHFTAGHTSQHAPLLVRIDPRVAAAGVTQEDLIAQLGLNLKIRAAISETQRTLDRVDDALAGARASRRARLDSLQARLETAGGPYPQPMLLDQLEYLYGMTTQADQRPGQDAYLRYATLMKELGQIQAELRR